MVSRRVVTLSNSKVETALTPQRVRVIQGKHFVLLYGMIVSNASHSNASATTSDTDCNRPGAETANTNYYSDDPLALGWYKADLRVATAYDESNVIELLYGRLTHRGLMKHRLE